MGLRCRGGGVLRRIGSSGYLRGPYRPAYRPSRCSTTVDGINPALP